MFAAGLDGAKVAKQLRVSVRSVQRWRRAWQEAGDTGLRSTGSAARPKLSGKLFAVLEGELAKGPVAHGWADQTSSRASGPCYGAVLRPTPPSPTPISSSGTFATASASSSAAATSSTRAWQPPGFLRL